VEKHDKQEAQVVRGAAKLVFPTERIGDPASAFAKVTLPDNLLREWGLFHVIVTVKCNLSK
jgi:hypothetical protein